MQIQMQMQTQTQNTHTDTDADADTDTDTGKDTEERREVPVLGWANRRFRYNGKGFKGEGGVRDGNGFRGATIRVFPHHRMQGGTVSLEKPVRHGLRSGEVPRAPTGQRL